MAKLPEYKSHQLYLTFLFWIEIIFLFPFIAILINSIPINTKNESHLSLFSRNTENIWEQNLFYVLSNCFYLYNVIPRPLQTVQRQRQSRINSSKHGWYVFPVHTAEYIHRLIHNSMYLPRPFPSIISIQSSSYIGVPCNSGNIEMNFSVLFFLVCWTRMTVGNQVSVHLKIVKSRHTEGIMLRVYVHAFNFVSPPRAMI